MKKKKPWNSSATRKKKKEIEGKKVKEEETKKKIGGEKLSLRRESLWKVKMRFEITAIMAKREVGENNVWKDALVANI